MIPRTIIPSKLLNATLWLLSIAVLLAAVLPTLGMVLQAAAPDLVTIEICSAGGNRQITVAASDAPDSSLPAKNSGQAHCPLCVIPGTTATLPPIAGGLSVAHMQVAASLEALGTETLLPTPPHTTALSRAPPVLV